jgi:hypothetical protein
MMEWFNILMARLRALFRRESVLQDIEEELRVHVEMEMVALLGHAFWQRRFGGDPAIIGQALTLGGQSRTVIGIMPRRSRSLIGKMGFV